MVQSLPTPRPKLDIPPAYKLTAKGTMLIPKSVRGWLTRTLPYTASLTSVPFIAKIALIARIGVALARIGLNYPAFNHNPNYTPEQKRTSFYERIFIEGGGTVVYHVGMYLAMDLAARGWERGFLSKHFLKGLHQLTDLSHPKTLKGMDGKTKKELSNFLETFYRHFYETRPNANNPVAGLIHLNMFGKDLYGTKGPRSHHGLLDRLRTSLEKWPQFKPFIDDIVTHASTATKPLSRSLALKGGTLVQLIGVAVGCVLGGTVIQQLNDHVIRPIAQKLSGAKDTDLVRPPQITLPGTRVTPDATPTPFVLASAPLYTAGANQTFQGASQNLGSQPNQGVSPLYTKTYRPNLVQPAMANQGMTSSYQQRGALWQ